MSQCLSVVNGGKKTSTNQANTLLLFPAFYPEPYLQMIFFFLTFSLPLVLTAVCSAACHCLHGSSLASHRQLCLGCSFKTSVSFLFCFFLIIIVIISFLLLFLASKTSLRHSHICTASASPCSTAETETIQERCVSLQIVASTSSFFFSLWFASFCLLHICLISFSC